MSDVEVVTTRRMIRYGSIGVSVEAAQRQLNLHGADPLLKVDGVFGKLTEAATRAFQGTHDLVPDGRIGLLTWPALYAEPLPRRSLPLRTPGAQMLLLAGRLEIEGLLRDWYGAGMNRAQCGVLLHDFLQHSEPWTQMGRQAQLALALEVLR